MLRERYTLVHFDALVAGSVCAFLLHCITLQMCSPSAARPLMDLGSPTHYIPA